MELQRLSIHALWNLTVDRDSCGAQLLASHVRQEPMQMKQVLQFVLVVKRAKYLPRTEQSSVLHVGLATIRIREQRFALHACRGLFRMILHNQIVLIARRVLFRAVRIAPVASFVLAAHTQTHLAVKCHVHNVKKGNSLEMEQIYVQLAVLELFPVQVLQYAVYALRVNFLIQRQRLPAMIVV